MNLDQYGIDGFVPRHPTLDYTPLQTSVWGGVYFSNIILIGSDGWFAEEFDIADLKKANAQLNEFN